MLPTSPFYPLFAALDVNAKIHEGRAGVGLWAEMCDAGIEARKAILTELQNDPAVYSSGS